MNATAQTDMVNWIAVILVISVIAITLTIVRVKELKYGVRKDTSRESNAEGNSQTSSDGTRR